MHVYYRYKTIFMIVFASKKRLGTRFGLLYRLKWDLEYHFQSQGLKSHLIPNKS